jgi:ABC-2 type transport system permease protein
MTPGIRVIVAIVAKDLRLFSRDRFYVLVTAMGLVFFGGLFWVLPTTVQATVPVGVHVAGPERLLLAGLEGAAEGGLAVTAFGSRQELVDAVAVGEEVQAGLSVPDGFLADLTAGRPVTVEVVLAADAPESLQPALAAAVRELAFAVVGEDPPVVLPALDEMVLGEDRAADPLSLREQLRPLLIFLVLMTEMLALASLVAVEVVQRTAAAVLVTPVRTGQLLAAKGALGTMLAFGQVMLIALVTGTLQHRPLLVALTLLLGSVLLTGVGLLGGALGQDFMSIMFWSMLLLVPLAIPAFSVLFPGTAPWWVQVLPTHGLIEALVLVTGYGEGWGPTWPHLLALAGWSVIVFGAGTALLAWRVRRA